LAEELSQRGLSIDHATVGRFLHREKQSYKKTMPAAEQERPKIARFRARWKAYQGKVDPSRLVFIDETWIKTNMAPLRGWGPRCTFNTYVETELLKTLKPSDIVVIDNLGSHKNKAIGKLIRGAGARLILLPPYSPDLNPIEQVFAKTKHLMRKAMARTVEAAIKHLAQVLEAVSAKECANYLKNSGYAAI
jgi:transposase